MQCVEDKACVFPGLGWASGRCLPHARIDAIVDARMDAWKLSGHDDDNIERFEPSSLEATIGKWPTTMRLLRVLVQNWIDHEKDGAELHSDFPFRVRSIELELTEERREAHRVSNRRWAAKYRALISLIPEAHELHKKRKRDSYHALSPEQKREYNRRCYQRRLERQKAKSVPA